MKRAKASLVILALLAIGLTFWLGPRPVYELWVAEELDASRLRELFPGCPEVPPTPASSMQRILELAAANGIAAAALPTPLEGGQLFDADNDGDLDLFLPGPATAPPGEARQEEDPGRFTLHQNDGSGHFREIGDHLGEAFVDPRAGGPGNEGSTTWCVDLEQDGLLDIIVSLEEGSFLCLRNRFARRHYLVVRPVSSNPLEPSPGKKIRVTVVSGGVEQVRLLDVRAGAPLSCPSTAHFGLGSLDRVDAVMVEWPSGLRAEVHDVPVDGEEVLLEPESPEKERKES